MVESVGVRLAPTASKVDFEDLDLREKRRRCRPGVVAGVPASEGVCDSAGVLGIEVEAVEVRRRMN
jgi:hypothetical protein